MIIKPPDKIYKPFISANTTAFYPRFHRGLFGRRPPRHCDRKNRRISLPAASCNQSPAEI